MPSVTATSRLLNNESLMNISGELRLLITFAIVYIVAAVMLFGYVIEE
jgi:hypothetical protein